MVTTMAVGVSEVKLLEQGQELQGIIREAINSWPRDSARVKNTDAGAPTLLREDYGFYGFLEMLCFLLVSCRPLAKRAPEPSQGLITRTKL